MRLCHHGRCDRICLSRQQRPSVRPGAARQPDRKQDGGRDGARPDDAFSFTVTLSDTAVAGAYGGMTFTDGVATFPLKHGESRTASGLPAGIHYQVREAAVAGYTASSEGASGSIPQDGAAQARFVNRKDNGNGENGGGDILTPPRTGDGARPGLWLALAALALLLSWAFGRRRSAG